MLQPNISRRSKGCVRFGIEYKMHESGTTPRCQPSFWGHFPVVMGANGQRPDYGAQTLGLGLTAPALSLFNIRVAFSSTCFRSWPLLLVLNATGRTVLKFCSVQEVSLSATRGLSSLI